MHVRLGGGVKKGRAQKDGQQCGLAVSDEELQARMLRRFHIRSFKYG